MRRIVVLLIGIGISPFGQAWGQGKKDAGPAPKARQTGAAIAKALDQEFVIAFDNDIPFKGFCEVLTNNIKTPDGQSLRFIIEHRAFAAEDEGAPDPGEAMVKAPALLKSMPAGRALRHAIDQLPGRNGAFVIRDGFIEITTRRRARPEALLAHPITASFDKCPLEEALAEIADRSGVSIVFDPGVGPKLKTPVSATFKNNVTAEGAARLLAGLAGVIADVREDALFITLPEAAPAAGPAGAKKGDLRIHNRRIDLALRDLADWSGRAIILDPRQTHVLPAEGAPRDDSAAELPRVSATFKAGVSAEAAARILADQAELVVVSLDGALYVTDWLSAERVRSEPERFRDRKGGEKK